MANPEIAHEIYSLEGKRVWIAGHKGMLGSALRTRLKGTRAFLLTADREAVDLRRQAEVEQWISYNQPEAVFVAAATLGGIEANRTTRQYFFTTSNDC
jgi:GDP-L-fucose synthase